MLLLVLSLGKEKGWAGEWLFCMVNILIGAILGCPPHSQYHGRACMFFSFASPYMIIFLLLWRSCCLTIFSYVFARRNGARVELIRERKREASEKRKTRIKCGEWLNLLYYGSSYKSGTTFFDRLSSFPLFLSSPVLHTAYPRIIHSSISLPSPGLTEIPIH